jgi:hypothetical protein
MRCEDVTRELAAPTTGRDPLALREHLAACPNCSAWTEADARLTRLWDETRPVEPSESAWGALWAEVRDRLDRTPAELEVVSGRGLTFQNEPVAAVPFLPPWRWRRLGVAVFSAAQAAAILVAVSLLVSRSPTEARAERVVEIDPGQFIKISIDDRVVRAVALNNDANGTNGLDPGYEMLNAFEAMAE